MDEPEPKMKVKKVKKARRKKRPPVEELDMGDSKPFKPYMSKEASSEIQREIKERMATLENDDIGSVLDWVATTGFSDRK